MALSTEALYEKAVALSGDVNDDTFLELAKSLRQLQDRDGDLYKKVVAKSGLGSRKAYYLVAISRWFEHLPTPRSRLRAIGWTKLQIIGPAVTDKNWEQLLTAAENSSAAQLKSIVKGEKPVENAHCVLMYFTPEQYAIFEQALLANGGTRSGRGILDKELAITAALKKSLATK